MPSDARSAPAAELMSIRTLVEELQARVNGLARTVESTAAEDVARVLYETERALRTAVRQLARAERMLS
jgi:hypothetical protein